MLVNLYHRDVKVYHEVFVVVVVEVEGNHGKMQKMLTESFDFHMIWLLALLVVELLTKTPNGL